MADKAKKTEAKAMSEADKAKLIKARKEAAEAAKIAKEKIEVVETLKGEHDEALRAGIEAEFDAKLAKLRAWKREQLEALGIGRTRTGETHYCPVGLREVTERNGSLYFKIVDRKTGEVLEEASVPKDGAAITAMCKDVTARFRPRYADGDWDGNHEGGWKVKLRKKAGLQKSKK